MTTYEEFKQKHNSEAIKRATEEGEKVVQIIKEQGFHAAFEYVYGPQDYETDACKFNYTYFVSSYTMLDIMKFCNNIAEAKQNNETLMGICNAFSMMFENIISTSKTITDLAQKEITFVEVNPDTIHDIMHAKKDYINGTMEVSNQINTIMAVMESNNVSDVEGMDEVLTDSVELYDAINKLIESASDKDDKEEEDENNV